MKKTIAVLFAVMMMLLSAVPAFAAVSPQPNTFKYKVEVIPTEGGNGDYKFTTGIDENGDQDGVKPKHRAKLSFRIPPADHCFLADSFFNHPARPSA